MAGLSVRLAATATTSTPWTAFSTAKIDGPGHSAIRVSDRHYLPLAAGHDLGVVQNGSLTVPLDNLPGDRTSVVVTNISGQQYVLLRSDVALVPLAPPSTDCGPAIDSAVTAAVAPLNVMVDELEARVATIKGKVAANAADIAND